MWWTVEVRTDSPRPEATIDLKAFIRQATSAEISLSNPLAEPITFEVFYNGEGLIGDSSFSLEPKSVGTYNLIFSPLGAGSSQGTIGFLNEKVGEFWYDLNLQAEENPVVNLDLLECELGKVANHTITLENPTGQELYLEFRNSNPTNFEIVPDKILLPAYESLKVKLQYSPTNLDASSRVTSSSRTLPLEDGSTTSRARACCPPSWSRTPSRLPLATTLRRC